MLREFFTREAAKEAAKSVDRSELIGVRQALALVQQKRRAAELLWASGHLAEGIRLIRNAYETMQEALVAAARLSSNGSDGLDLGEDRVDEAVGADDQNATLASGALRAFVEGALGDTLEPAKEALGADAPASDRDVSTRDAANFEHLVAATKRGEAVLDEAKPIEMLVASSRRRIGVFVVALVALSVALVAFVVSQQVKANAPWRADYFANANLRGEPIVDREPELELRWGPNSPRSGIPADGFSARFETCLELDEARRFEAKLGTDDGGRLYVNGTQRINRWRDQAYGVSDASFEIPAGQNLIRVEFYDRGGDARLEFSMEHEDFDFAEHIRYIQEASECEGGAPTENEGASNNEDEADEDEANEEPTANGDEEEPTANGDEEEPTANGDEEEPTANGDANEAETDSDADENPAASAMDMLGGTPLPMRRATRRAETP